MSEPEPSESKRAAHVLILGWAGSAPRQLRAVVGHYERLGADTLTAHAQVFRNMAHPRGWGLEGAALAARLTERMRGDDAPVLVHLFSNAGFWMWSAALRHLTGAHRARVMGVVIDSAPGYPAHISPRFYAEHSTRAMLPLLLRSLGRAPTAEPGWLRAPVWLFMRCWYHVSTPQQREAERSLELVATTGDWPMLVLFSDADELCPAEHVAAFVERARETGRDVWSERWPDCPHITAMVRRRAAYFERVTRFHGSAFDAFERASAGNTGKNSSHPTGA